MGLLSLLLIRTSLPHCRSLFSGKRDFAGQRQRRRKGRHIQPIASRDKSPARKPRNSGYLHDTRKSLFVWDCVVGPGEVGQRFSVNDLVSRSMMRMIGREFSVNDAEHAASWVTSERSRVRRACKPTALPLRRLLHRVVRSQCLLLAQSGHVNHFRQCPLSGVKRTPNR
jgi:hypothetical protein